MRRFIMAVGFAALCQTAGAGPARGEVLVMAVPAAQQEERPDAGRPMDTGSQMWDLMLEQFTVPLGPAELWPWVTRSWRWIGADDDLPRVVERPPPTGRSRDER
jgi:hypothetical protein